MSRRRQDVPVWNVQDRRGCSRNVQPWVVRWMVDDNQSSRSFRLRALADHFPASILLAHNDGDEFDRASGGLRPSEVVMLRASSLWLPKSGWGRIDVTEADVLNDEAGEPKTGSRSVLRSGVPGPHPVDRGRIMHV